MDTWQGLDPEGLAEVAAWMKEGRAGESKRAQHPIDELIAEHRLTAPVLLAMESEIRKLARRQAIRFEVWELIVEFIGNFLHLCHRRKEEEALFVPMAATGWKERDDVSIEHGRAERATHGICEAVSDGDWEMTVRLGSAYAYGMRRHMQREELSVLRLAKRSLSPEQVATAREAFDRIEATVMPAGRKRLLEIIRELCKLTDVDVRPYGL